MQFCYITISAVHGIWHWYLVDASAFGVHMQTLSNFFLQTNIFLTVYVNSPFKIMFTSTMTCEEVVSGCRG